MEQDFIFSEDISPANRAFLFGDAVSTYFFVRNGALIMAEECYFFLMASMRKMRLNIPLTYTLEFFQDLLARFITEKNMSFGTIRFMAFRKDGKYLTKSEIEYFCEILAKEDPLLPKPAISMDIIKEISVNTGLLCNIPVHSAENIYAEIYAFENDLDDVILLNHQKRIARSIHGNLLFLEGNTIKIPKYSEGALISPLLENFVTFVHKNNLAETVETEMNPFESQKADEILVASDSKGIFPVKTIRNKNFGQEKFLRLTESWRSSFI